MTTIKEVAQLANVSVATVSRVINKVDNVSYLTKERVEKAIEELHYKPNDVARTLFQGNSNMVALFVPDITNPYYPELARAIEDVMNQHGLTFILCNTDDSYEKEQTYLKNLEQKKIDGIIMSSSSISKQDAKRISAPIVTLDRKVGMDLPSVTVDNYKGACQAMEHLRNIGCRRIAHIRGPLRDKNAGERLEGFLDMVKDENWFDSTYVQSGEYSYETAVQATFELLKKNPEVDGVFVANDLMAAGVLKAAIEMKKIIPDDMAVISFDGINLSKTTIPTLSTMAQPIYEMGSTAANMIIEQLKEPSKKIKSKVF